MISVEERERAEKGRSAHDAAPSNGSLLMSDQTVARYLAPPEDTTLDDLVLRLFPSLAHYGSIRVFEISKC